ATLVAGVSSGTAPYTYSWSTGATTSSITVSPTETTIYEVTVTDQSGCSAIASGTVNVNERPLVTILADDGDNILCFDQEVTLTADASAGTAPYTYLWNTGATTAEITVTPVAATTVYSVTVTDANGCDRSDNITIEKNPDLVIDIGATIVEDVACNGDDCGTIAVMVSGGTAPYTYLWDGGESTEDLSGLVAGTYNVTVTEANGCEDSAGFTIDEAGDLVI